jgi:hypothetical protein
MLKIRETWSGKNERLPASGQMSRLPSGLCIAMLVETGHAMFRMRRFRADDDF